MIALVDCNNFYASVERLFNPSLNGKPVVVLSNNDGCAIARSEEAREIGIEMGMPVFMIAEKLRKKEVAIFSSNYTLYGSMSKRVMEILKTFGAKLEVYSIDEAFLDLSEYRGEDLVGLAMNIRETILSHTGLPISIGIAPTKTLAKMANRFAKKQKTKIGIHAATSPAAINALLAATETADIWGIGHQYHKLLLEQGYKTAADLLKAPEEWIRRNMSVQGQRLLFELRGTRAFGWEERPPAKKNICTARSFGKLLTDLKDITQAVASHAANCARKLRNDQSCARSVHVFLQTNPYRSGDQQYMAGITLRLPVASSSSTEIIHYAGKALQLIYRPGFNYLKAGVMLMDIVAQQQIQLGLFDNRDRIKDAALMKTIDQSNNAFGKDMLRYGSHGYGKKWKLRAQRLSPCYTTRINQVMTVKS
ncbi:MAG TPA: Y-family DNA polymerase [Chitinophagaceae bacterium]|nr:Y-family DNA polymerase [Chitinophagaceae bacterium]